MVQEYIEVLDANEQITVDLDTAGVERVYIIIDNTLGDAPPQHDIKIQQVRNKGTKRERRQTAVNEEDETTIRNQSIGITASTMEIQMRNKSGSEDLFRLRTIKER